MANRIIIQATITEFSIEIFLGGQ